jgi:integrase
MSLFKRKDSSQWWIKLTINGRRIQKSTGTDDRKAAQEYHNRLKVDLWEQSRLGTKPGYLWQDAALRWLKETQHKATHKDDLWILRGLDVHLFGVKLTDIDRDKLDLITAARIAEGVENGTVNRMLAVVRAILRRAALDWGWIDQAPKVRMLSVPKRRIRFLAQDEAEKLLSELPPHMEAMARFSLETGLRQANVMDLQWSQVDLIRECAWIHPDQAKARRAISVPMSPIAATIVRNQVGKCQTHVFCYKGRPVTVVNTKAWRAALKRAGIKDFRWHDLRHTWASWHAQTGTPLNVLQELGGWESVEMVRRYAHLSGEHLSEYARSMTESPNPLVTK